MSRLDETSSPAVRQSSTLRTILVATAAATGVGLVAGAANCFVEFWSHSPMWLAIFLHTLGPWSAVTLAVGHALRGQWAVAAWAGLVTQWALVVGYYVRRDLMYDFLELGDVFRTEYLLVACVAGPVYGAAGAALNDRRDIVRILCLALTGAPWLTSGVRDLISAGDPDLTARAADHSVIAGLLCFAVGLCLPWLICRSSRDWLMSVPLAAVMSGVLLLTLFRA